MTSALVLPAAPHPLHRPRRAPGRSGHGRGTGGRQSDAEDTLALLVRAREAEEPQRTELLDRVIVSHLWLAQSLARRFDHRGEELDDLVQVARSGLVEAARRFDPKHQDFIAFAVPTIVGVLKRHFRDHGWLVRPPRRTQELVLSVRREWEELAQEIGAVPRDADMARRLGETAQTVNRARSAAQAYAAAPIDDELGAHCTAASDDGEVARCEARLVLAGALSRLTPDERRLVWMRFFEERSQSDIAAELRTSQMQVSRLQARVLRKLRAVVGVTDQVACRLQ